MVYLEALLLGLLLSVAAFIFGWLVGKIGESSVEGDPVIQAARARLPKMALVESKLDLRRAELKAEITRTQAVLSTLRRQRFTLEREVMDARREADAPVRVVGREGSTAFHYRAWLVNRQVQAAQAEGKAHPTLDSDWATPQVVEVWADNLTDARRELQRIYPMPLGFSILNIKLEVEEAAAQPQAAAG